MKLIRFRKNNTEKPGVILNGEYYDVASFGEDYNQSFFENNGLLRLQNFIDNNFHQLEKIASDISLLCPIASPSKIVCVGLNFATHVSETKSAVPIEPVLFLKATTAITGPNDDIIIPKNSTKTDWEVELAIVISKKAQYVSESEAINYITGYCLHNDVSEREFQLERNGTWDKGKGCDSFAPLGPWLVTPDEIEDVNNLRLWLSVNGHLMQDGNTSDFIFSIPYLISYISNFMTLLPGDIISTGTPSGVGMGRTPQVFLKEGDIVELGIDGLSSSKQHVRNYSAGFS